jgi:hypothetical protein
MAAAIDVPYTMVQMMPDLVPTVMGEGTDDQGRKFMIQRYVSKTTHKVYECRLPASGDPTCAEMPGTKPDSPLPTK